MNEVQWNTKYAYIFFNKKTLVCFSFLAVIIMCLILWLLLKVILAYRERGAKNESLQVSKTLGTYHWEMIWNWHWETQRILPALDSDLWEVKTRNSLPLRRLSQLFYLLTSSGILQLYTLLFYHSCTHSYTVKRSRMCIWREVSESTEERSRREERRERIKRAAANKKYQHWTNSRAQGERSPYRKLSSRVTSPLLQGRKEREHITDHICQSK